MRATRDREHAVRAEAGTALDHLGTIAVAFSVAALLRPVMDRPSDASENKEGFPANGSLQQAPPERSGLLARAYRILDRAGAGSAPRRPR
jgi:hypothetical protein